MSLLYKYRYFILFVIYFKVQDKAGHFMKNLYYCVRNER